MDHTCLLCRCICTSVTETHLCVPCSFSFLVLCICNEPEYLTEKDYGHTFLPLCAAQVTIESYTKETMPPDWILPTESVTLNIKWILPDKHMICGVKHYAKEAYLLLPPFLTFTMETRQSVNWWPWSVSIMGHAHHCSLLNIPDHDAMLMQSPD